MAATSNTTLLEDLFDPQVVADYIDQKLIDGIRFAPLSKIDQTLVGRPGDEVTLPYYSYVGMAESVAEGADIPIAKLTQDKKQVKIHKIGRAIQFTDEALLSAYNNDIAEEAAMQVVTAINDRLDSELLHAMRDSATLTETIASSGSPTTGLANAIGKFGEDIDGEKVIVVPPSFYTRLLKSEGWIPNTDIGANIIIRGTVGSVYGMQVVISNRLIAHDEYNLTTDTTIDQTKTYYTYDSESGEYEAVAEPDVSDIGTYYEKTSINNEAYIIKPGALAIFMKRDTLVEFERDKLDQTNYIIGSKLFAPYVYDTRKLIKITLSA